MAGPLSSEEIEDVVSSVRRLVSNEQRPRTLSRDLKAERLLLTPALRVVPETSPLSPLVLDAALQDVVQDPRDIGTPKPDLAAHDRSATAPVVPADAAVDLPAPEVAAGPVFEDPEAEWEDEVWAEPGTVSLAELALGVEEAEVLAGPAPVEIMAEPPESEDHVEARDEVGSEWAEDGPIPFVPLRRRAEYLAARLAAGEVMDTPRPEADPTVIAEVEVPMPLIGMPAQEPGPERRPTELLDEDGTPLSVLDEAALQEIVRLTLRAELQGDLGERITRNVRKLVRAEINRALMARDLD